MKKLVRGIAAALALSIGSASAGDTSPKLTAPNPVPDTYAKAQWCWASTCSPGAWYTDKQLQIVAAKMDYLEKSAAKDCVDQQIAAAKPGFPNWVWFAGGLVIGVVGGYVTAKGL